MNKAKAWTCDCNDDGESTVVFATSRGLARIYLTRTDTFDGYDFLDIKGLRRIPELDYLNHPDGYEVDWNNPRDRAALVKVGYHCLDPLEEDCENCSAKEFCDANE